MHMNSYNHSRLRFSMSIILNHRIKYTRQMPNAKFDTGLLFVPHTHSKIWINQSKTRTLHVPWLGSRFFVKNKQKKQADLNW